MSTSSRMFPPPLPSLSFHCLTSVTGACPPFHVGAHSWVARICQPWEWSPSRSWLPIVEAPGCLRHPTSICDAVNSEETVSFIVVVVMWVLSVSSPSSAVPPTSAPDRSYCRIIERGFIIISVLMKHSVVL